MAETQEPLLPDGVAEHGNPKGWLPLPMRLAKWTLKALMWAVFMAWVFVIFADPFEPLHDMIISPLFALTGNTVFGLTGSTFSVISGPILILSALAYVYISAFPRQDYHHLNKKRRFSSRFRLWTFPVLVDGPFGVVSAAELIGILLFSFYVIWALATYTIQSEGVVSNQSWSSRTKGEYMVKVLGLNLGSIGMFCLAFLFLPVARGSILLRLIDIPFEHATKYHVWLGHLTMMIFTTHGICFMITSAMDGRFIEKLLQWSSAGVANLPGVISLLAGLLMWVTSLCPVRKRYFELFFYTHQLYVVFIVFLAMHVGDFIYSFSAGAIFLFMLDRFLRFCQSRRTVDVISAARLPCGTVELVLSKPPNLRYNALSFVFLQVKELSWLQWHPFSVSSSPLDGDHHVAVLIKVLGEWTEKLRDTISHDPEKQHQKHLAYAPKTKRITASVEGPYGHELAYYLMYENLILVAGGIGISPFLAILSDIFHRIKDKKPCLPKNILVVWAVKKSKELTLISSIDAESKYSSFSDKLRLKIQAFVTQESELSLEEGEVENNFARCSIICKTTGCAMSSLVGTGNNNFAGAYFFISMIGFIALYGLLEVAFITPFDVPLWMKGLLLEFSMVASVVVFGGLVVLFWHCWERKSSSSQRIKFGVDDDDDKSAMFSTKESKIHKETCKVNLMNLMTTRYGCRPSFQEIFNSFAQNKGNVDVGVIVCGPPTLQSSVAKECRSQNLRGRWNQPIFHFNSHSFDL